jgi:hypothetical protein
VQPALKLHKHQNVLRGGLADFDLEPRRRADLNTPFVGGEFYEVRAVTEGGDL